VNAGRVAANSVSRKIGDNPNPINVKFTGKATYDA
jgi:photosystem I subunit 2